MTELERFVNTNLAIEVDGILPERLFGRKALDVAKLPIWIGRNQVELGSAFRVHGAGGENNGIRWTGDLGNVHWIGAGMKSGEIEIQSDAGLHVGSGMSGGIIRAQASVGDFAAAEMRGGLVRIAGNAGDHLGGSYTGSPTGMNRGEILVEGNAGRGLGQRMARGLIAVRGNVDQLCGWNMLAGSIIVYGSCAAECGLGMKRGKIIQCSNQNAPLSPTFTAGSKIESGVLNLFAARLQQLDFQPSDVFQSKRFCILHGDQLEGGRGEILQII
jgi:formylmethanofuran dehydrogenase subunit C